MLDSPDEIGQRIAVLMRRAAEASRITLECHIEAARLLASMQEQHGYKGKRFAEFALEHGVSSRTDAFDILLLTEADDNVLEPHDDPYISTHRGGRSGAILSRARKNNRTSTG